MTEIDASGVAPIIIAIVSPANIFIALTNLYDLFSALLWAFTFTVGPCWGTLQGI